MNASRHIVCTMSQSSHLKTIRQSGGREKDWISPIDSTPKRLAVTTRETKHDWNSTITQVRHILVIYVLWKKLRCDKQYSDVVYGFVKFWEREEGTWLSYEQWEKQGVTTSSVKINLRTASISSESESVSAIPSWGNGSHERTLAYNSCFHVARCKKYRRPYRLFPARFNGFAILACNYLYPLRLDFLVWLHFEIRLFDDERPYIVT